MMKKVISWIVTLVLTASLGLTAFAADNVFNPTLDVVRGETKITVTIENSSLLQEQTPSLTIPCGDWYGATVTLNGWNVSSQFADESVTFTVAKGGTYVIKRLYPGSGSHATPSTEEQTAQKNPFTDVKADAYYFNAVLWAYENHITIGSDAALFGPEKACTRAEMVTFLWRASGCPAAEMTENPFADVSEDAYYYDAVLWAVEQGITTGTGEDTFSPNAVCTRAQAVTFLHRCAGVPAANGTTQFKDVDGAAYYSGAVRWATREGITIGTGTATFSPDNSCTRAQIVTFLFRLYAE